MTHLVAAFRTPPSGPAFTVVLVCHVAVVLVTLGTAVAGAVGALRVLNAKGEVPRSVRAYFSHGVNWAGRALYLVPVFGAALLAMSGGAYQLGAPWVVWGLVLWGAATALAESAMWPAERRVQRGLHGTHGTDDTDGTGGGGVPAEVRRACRAMCVATAGVLALVVAAMVVMVARP